ncbi:MAG TPA: type I glyceraldehyde-3-phosphate dehydrogenase [Candidatus Humimicrobiaceae bacterium]|nr:type I glyceraldehyde-3-phosphate dehydrogenase [Candidatus Humimicrobiaceae bacterium]
MPIKIAINGFGRIGRPTFRRIVDNHPNLEVAAINDLTDPETLAHLLKYDSVYGVYRKTVKAVDSELLIDGTSKGKRVKVLAEKDPANLPWKEMDIDIVLECTGAFTNYDKAEAHLKAGAKKVIISAPSKDPEKIASYILGVNEEKFDAKKDEIVDMGSCTTNCLAPIAKVLHDNFKIVKGFMTTIHSYTNDQKILDLPHKDLRRARAAALNIIPTSTGAAKALGRVLPELAGKLDGIAIRVPTPTVSVVDLVCQVEKKTTAEEVNFTLKKASQNAKLKGILGIEDALLVSSDYIGNSYSAIVDAENTKVLEDNLVKILGWYDNEWAYACRLAEFAEFVGKKL